MSIYVLLLGVGGTHMNPSGCGKLQKAAEGCRVPPKAVEGNQTVLYSFVTSVVFLCRIALPSRLASMS